MVANFTNAILRVVDSSGSSQGTAFLVAPDLAVTCAHVIEATGAGPGETVDLIFHATKEPTQAHIVADWWGAPDAEDVAVLRLEGELPAEFLPLGRVPLVFETIPFLMVNPNILSTTEY